MSILRKVLGYTIRPAWDWERAAVFTDRSAMTVYVNLFRLKEVRYRDFMYCVYGLFESEVEDGAAFDNRVKDTCTARLSCVTCLLKVLILFATLVVALGMNGLISVFINFLVLVLIIYNLRKLDTVEVTK